MNIRTSDFSDIYFEPASRLLTMTWNKESQKLDEAGVKLEIGRIVEYIRQYSVKHVIIDSRNYFFRNNSAIQTWITHTYMAQIMDSGVLKYAIIVNSEIIPQVKGDHDADEEVLPVVDYFTEVEEAKKWILK